MPVCLCRSVWFMCQETKLGVYSCLWPLRRPAQSCGRHQQRRDYQGAFDFSPCIPPGWSLIWLCSLCLCLLGDPSLSLLWVTGQSRVRYTRASRSPALGLLCCPRW